MLHGFPESGLRIRFVDTADEACEAGSVGVTMEALMARIHGRLPDGTLVEGVEVFRRLYPAAGFGVLVAPKHLPGIAHLLDLGSCIPSPWTSEAWPR